MTTARIPPIEPPYSEPVREALDRLMPPGVPPLALFRTVAVNERVFLRLAAGGLLDRGSLSLREREILIDRTCARCGSEYEWGVHVAFFGPKASLTPAELADTRAADPETTGFAPRERLLLRLVDELHDTSDLGDATYAELRASFRDEQVIEMIAVVGFYHMVSFLTNALRVPLEPFAARFDDHPT